MVTNGVLDAFTRSAGPDVELLSYEPIPFGLSFRVLVRGDEIARRIQVQREGRDLTSIDLAKGMARKSRLRLEITPSSLASCHREDRTAERCS